jgi:hypothetical protein
MTPLRGIRAFVLTVTLTSVLGCARTDWIDRTLVTENVTGVWSGSLGESTGFRDVRLELQNEGAKVSGLIRFLPGSTSAPIVGSVAGDVFTFKDARGSYSGELTVGGDEMTGRIFSPLGTRQVSLRRLTAK